MTHRRTNLKSFKNSREIRNNQTESEAILWRSLRAHRLNDVHFRRQHTIGSYIVDFCAPRQKLIIEVDGSQHLDQQKYNTERTAYLESKGYRVFRFWNSDVMNNSEGVLVKILELLQK